MNLNTDTFLLRQLIWGVFFSVKTRCFVPTATELLYGVTDREPVKISDRAIKDCFKRMEHVESLCTDGHNVSYL